MITNGPVFMCERAQGRRGGLGLESTSSAVNRKCERRQERVVNFQVARPTRAGWNFRIFRKAH